MTFGNVETWLHSVGAGREDCPALENRVTTLFDELRDPVLRYVLAFGIPIQDGEEVVQEVFLALFQHLRAGRPDHNLRGWLFRIAHNLALKRRSSSGARLASGVEHSDPNPNPEEVCGIRQRQSRLLAAVAALPEKDRCCLNLRAEGLLYREISEVTGMSLGAVALSLARSLDRLKRADR